MDKKFLLAKMAIVHATVEQPGAATLAAISAGGGELPSGPGQLSPAAVTTQCIAAWRVTQGIYRFDPTLYAALIATPVTGEIPSEVLLHLPEWCIYIETPEMTVPTREGVAVAVLGLWYWLDQAPGRSTILCIGIDTGRRPPIIAQHVPLVGTVERAVDATLEEWAAALARGNALNAPPPEYREAASTFLPPALSLALYLCSRAADISGRAGRPKNPEPVATRRHGTRLYPAEGPRQWDVGVRLGAALRRAAQREHDRTDDGGGGGGAVNRHVAPHVRGAHWHTYLLGPRKGDAPQRRDLRWLPPIPVGVDDYDALVPTVHPVRLERDP
jgi:hypothetical protein